MLSNMRTTVTLDPDVEQLLHERMVARGVSFKQALNDAVRESATSRVDYVFETKSRPMGLKVDPDRLKEAQAALQDEDWIAKLGRSR